MKFILIAAFTFLIGVFSYGQNIPVTGFVGKDIDELMSVDGSPRTLMIGDKTLDVTQCHYKWRLFSKPVDCDYAPKIKNSDKPATEVTFYSCGEYVFELTRVSEYGYQREYLPVFISDGIVVSYAEPLEDHSCYVVGDFVHVNDFKIVTSPAGYENYVDIVDDDKRITSYSTFASHEYPIHFKVEQQDGSVVEDLECAKIYVASNEIWTSVEVAPLKIREDLKNLEKAYNVLKNFKIWKKHFELFPDQIKNNGFSKLAGLKPDVGFGDFLINAAYADVCCNGQGKGILNITMSMDAHAGFTFTKGVPGLSLEPFGGLMFVGTGGVKITAKLFDYALYNGSFASCGKNTVPMYITAYGGCGYAVKALDNDLISGSLDLTVSAGQFNVQLNPFDFDFAPGLGVKLVLTLLKINAGGLNVQVTPPIVIVNEDFSNIFNQ